MVIIWSQRVLLKNRALIGTESILEDFAMTLTSDFTPHPWSNKHSLGLVQGRYGKWEEKSAQTKILHRGSTITLTFDIETWFWFKHIIYQQHCLWGISQIGPRGEYIVHTRLFSQMSDMTLTFDLEFFFVTAYS